MPACSRGHIRSIYGPMWSYTELRTWKYPFFLTEKASISLSRPGRNIKPTVCVWLHSIRERLTRLKFPTVAWLYSHVRGDMIELYNILCCKYDTNVSDFISLNKSDTRGHQYKIFEVRTKLNLRKYLFVHRSANYWNTPPPPRSYG